MKIILFILLVIAVALMAMVAYLPWWVSVVVVVALVLAAKLLGGRLLELLFSLPFKAKGAVLRVPVSGEARANLHVGGTAVKSTLTRRERDICDAIGPELAKRGMIFVGIDVIGDYLTEINVTSPTGIREVKRFGGADIAALIWDAIERRR